MFHHPVRLRVVGCLLAVLDVEEVNWVPRSDVMIACGAHGNFPLLRALLNLLKGKSRP
jgi:hypothetical protein